jgi:hypothetical protein
MPRKAPDPKDLPVVCISDLHVGCGMAIMPKDGFTGDSGVAYFPSPLQQKLYDRWTEGFWPWVEAETGGRYNVLVNGDLIDGVHHQAVTQWSQNLLDQRRACVELLRPVRERAQRFIVVRGTESHVGASGQHDEAIAEALQAEKSPAGTWSHWEAFYRLGGQLCHFAHHIGATTSPFAKSSALQKVIALSYVNSGRWGDEPPVMFVRSHRHQCSWVGEPCKHGIVTCVVLPAWQLKTPYVHRIGIMSEPEYGGVILFPGNNAVYHKPWVERVERPEEI